MRLYRLVIWMTVFCGFLASPQAQQPGSVSVSTSIQVTSEALAAQPVGANWLSHADIRTTMNVYGKAMDESKRKAHGKVVRLVLPSKVA